MVVLFIPIYYWRVAACEMMPHMRPHPEVRVSTAPSFSSPSLLSTALCRKGRMMQAEPFRWWRPSVKDTCDLPTWLIVGE